MAAISTLAGVGIGHPSQNNIPAATLLDLFGDRLIWENWKPNRHGANKIRHIWRPNPGNAEWVQAVEDARRYWLPARNWGNMPIWSVPSFENEPHNSGQSNHTPQEAKEIVDQWDAETDGAPFIGFNILCGYYQAGIEWRRQYRALGGRDPVIETGHIYAYDGVELVRQAASTFFLHKTQWFGGPGRPFWLTEVGSWGPRAEMRWHPTLDSIASCMDAAKYLTTVGIGVALWFSSHYAQDDGWWMGNNLLHADGTLTPAGAYWRGHVNGTRQIPAALLELFQYEWRGGAGRSLAAESAMEPPRDSGPVVA